MRVVTKLARMEFTVGDLSPIDDELVITSGGDERTMKVKAYIEPDDIVAIVKVALRPAVLGYLLRLPMLMWRRKRAAAKQTTPANAIPQHTRTTR